MKRISIAVTLLIAACGSGSGTNPTQGIPGTQVVFELPRGTDMPELFSLPFPTDLRLNTDGTINLGGFPSGRRPDVIRGYLTKITATTKGWATNAAAYVRFAAPISQSSLPADEAASMTASASVFLMDIDPASPERGERIPVRLRYYTAPTVFVPENVLAILPVTGIPLLGKTRYALVVTRSVLDAQGQPLGTSATFEALKSKTANTNPEVERARAMYEPAFTELERAGVNREDVASLAVFTTQDTTGELFKVRDHIQTLPAPTPSVTSTCLVRTWYVECTGTYETPNYQAGTAPYQSQGGDIRFDVAGSPIVQRMETIEFVVTIPKGVQPAGGFPIALVSHGTGGSRRSHLGANDTGDILAQRGIAAIGIDQPLHGVRDDFCPSDPNQRDQCESLWTFNPSNISAARDNFRQGAIDNFQLLRAVKQLLIPMAMSTTGENVRFDASKIFFFGHSQGGITGPLFLAVEPEIKGAVLSGGGASLALGLLLKRQPTDIKSTIELLLDIEGLNELDIYHPLITVIQTFIERAEPLNYAPRFLDPPSPGAAKHVLITEGLGDNYTPNAATEALAVAAGASPTMPVLSPVSAFTLLGKSPIAPPVSSNASGATVVLAQYPAAADAATNPRHDGHFVVYWNSTAMKQYGDFLGTLASTGTATFTAP